MELLKKIAKPRPAGTAQNREIADLIGSYLEGLGYETKKIPFSCKVWEPGESFIGIDGNRLPLQASPFSEAFAGKGRAVVAGNPEELEKIECEGKILFLTGDLTQEALQPKNYPFYYPDEHKAIIERMEAKRPAAIIAVTGKSPMSGLKPFPLIEDGNFHIPIASIGKELFSIIRDEALKKEIELSIASRNEEATAYQLVASKRAKNPKGTIVICAHMDSKYNTDGALDNASGVAAMLYAAKGIETDRYDVDIVPFNSEEYYDPRGEFIYLEELRKSGKEVSLVINIDTVAHVGSKVAVASFNLDEKEQLELDSKISSCAGVVGGQPWYAGDHAVFAYGGAKCILIYSSDLFDGCLSYTHCPEDTIDLVDVKLIENAARFICRLVNEKK